jgi:hypothetical protein
VKASGLDELTDDKHADNKHNSEQKRIEGIDGLVHIVHARVDRLSLAPKLGYSQDHFLERDVTVAVPIKGAEALFGLFLPSRTHDLNHVLLVEIILAFNDEGEPDAPCESLGRLVVVQCFQNDGVCRVWIKDLLACDFLGNSSERSSDLVSYAADILHQSHRSPGSRAPVSNGVLLAAQRKAQAVLNDVVFFGKLVAVCWEQSARGIVHLSQKVDVAL